MNKVINIKNTYLLLVIIIGLIGLSTYSTYALFSSSVETEELVSISAIDLNISIDNFNTYNQIDLKPYEKKTILVKLSNSTDKLSYYKLWYEMINPNKVNNLIKVNKLITSSNNTSGTINSGNILEIKLSVVNYTNKDVSINLGVKKSNYSSIELEPNKNEIYDIEENKNISVWSTEDNDFEIGKCTKFSTKDKDSGIYKLELWNSINKYISGYIYLDNNKEFYVCVDQKDSSNKISQIILSAPTNDWSYSDDYNNKLLMINDKESFALTKNKYNELIDINEKYSIENVKDYYLDNVSYNIDNNVDLSNGGFARISLMVPHEENQNNLKIDKLFIDGKLSNYPTDGVYYLKDYDCDSISTNLMWDNKNFTISSNNINNNDTCDIYLSSSERLLSSAKQGDYVNYIGEGGILSNKEINCSENECIGNVTTCGNNAYDNYGWRLAYILNDGNNLVPYLISSSITDCITNNNINELNNLSIKYCNESYVYGNNCNKDKSSVNTWVFDNKDFERILSNGYNIKNCLDLNYNDSSCGYKNNLINIDGNYGIINGASLSYFSRLKNGIVSNNNDEFLGIRVVVKLDPNIKIISGSGLQNDPYLICNGDC